MADSPTEFDPLVDRAPSRYVVGIDLGTTNSAVAYVDTHESPWQVRLLAIPQLVAANQVESRDTLPSFHFQAPPQNLAEGSLRLPWHTDDQDWCVGVMARDEGVKSPGRLIASAKSLALPFRCRPVGEIVALARRRRRRALVTRGSQCPLPGAYPRRVAMPSSRANALAEQDIVITLPASFDEVARELTVEAASIAELPKVVLIEEPQAAFYAWVYKHDKNWHELVSAGDTILVCDIGGGTSDFTLIKVRKSEDRSAASQRVQFHRVAVGDHLILGGDNLDIALAHHIEAKLSGDGKLTPRQWDVLVRSCRRVKETLLGENAPEQATVNVPGSGTRLIGGGLQAQVTREEVEDLLVDGFLPRSSLSEMPVSGQSGFREFGLPFASDPAITRHMAAFLKAHGEVANADTGNASVAARPDVVLFNGGFFASPLLRERLLEVLSQLVR